MALMCGEYHARTAVAGLLIMFVAHVAKATEQGDPEVFLLPKIMRPAECAVPAEHGVRAHYDAIWRDFDQRISSASQLFLELSGRALASMPAGVDEFGAMTRAVQRFRDKAELAALPTSFENSRAVTIERQGKKRPMFARITEAEDWPCPLSAYAMPLYALNLWVRRECEHALMGLERDYELLWRKCEADKHSEIAHKLRVECHRVVDSEWERQAAAKARLQNELAQRLKQIKQEAEERERQASRPQNAAPAPEKPDSALKRGAASDVNTLRVHPTELINDKEFTTATLGGESLWRYLRNTQWSDGLETVYEWDRSGRLWVKQGKSRYFVYVEYLSNTECRLQSKEFGVVKLEGALQSTVMKQMRPSGRPLPELRRIDSK